LSAGTQLPRLEQPLKDRFIELGPLLRQTLFVSVHDRQRGEHDGVAGHAADLGAGGERRGQLLAVELGSVGTLREQRLAPAGQKGVDGTGVQ